MMYNHVYILLYFRKSVRNEVKDLLENSKDLFQLHAFDDKEIIVSKGRINILTKQVQEEERIYAEVKGYSDSHQDYNMLISKIRNSQLYKNGSLSIGNNNISKEPFWKAYIILSALVVSAIVFFSLLVHDSEKTIKSIYTIVSKDTTPFIGLILTIFAGFILEIIILWREHVHHYRKDKFKIVEIMEKYKARIISIFKRQDTFTSSSDGF